MRECVGLHGVGPRVIDGVGGEHPVDATVSMNLVGLGAGVAGRLAARFTAFAPHHGDDTAEMVLSGELASMIEDGTLAVRCVPGGGQWAGLTHPDDLAALRRVVAGSDPAHP